VLRYSLRREKNNETDDVTCKSCKSTLSVAKASAFPHISAVVFFNTRMGNLLPCNVHLHSRRYAFCSRDD
jgi:hypothetical protein